jgi:hypothetical protein
VIVKACLEGNTVQFEKARTVRRFPLPLLKLTVCCWPSKSCGSIYIPAGRAMEADLDFQIAHQKSTSELTSHSLKERVYKPIDDC